jgi:hypothetical protein
MQIELLGQVAVRTNGVVGEWGGSEELALALGA